jgi:CheY-like chemotaxis protein/CHASE3 domain sensor protein
MASNTSPGSAGTGGIDSVRLNLRLPPALVFGLATAIFVILLLGLLSWSALQEQFRARQETMATLNVDAAINAVLSGIVNAETGQRGFLITRNDDHLQPFIEARARVRADLERLLVLVEDDQVQLQRARALRELVLVRLDILQQVVDLQRSENWEGAVDLVTSGRGGQLMQEIRTIGAEMTRHEQDLLSERHLAMEKSRVRSAVTVYGGLAVLLLLVCIAGLVAAREVRRRDTESWLRAAQASLAANLQGEHRIETLGELVLQFMTERLRAPAGAFYVFDRKTLRRVAGFALAADAPESFPAGQGLAGEAARTDRIMDMAVPADHLRLESAMVSATPQRVLLLPAAYNRRVNAVLELALQQPPTAAERELLERIRETLGAAVNASLDRSRLEELLQETQRQAEELQAQQEELRVANEELQGQSDALKSSQVRLEQQQAELEQTNSQLEEQTRALEEHADRLARGEAELRARTEELQRANDYKSEFLANMSHELRTPLNSSLILAKLLADNKQGNLTEEQVRFAQTIHASGNDLLALINDILDLSKIEAGKMDIERESVSMERLADSLREGFAEMARSKGLEFDISIAPDVPARIETDSHRALQVLRNLLSNAIKFTSSGSVTVKVTASQTAAGAGVAFAVRDTGIGIAREQQQAIFEAFRQADGSTHRKYGGTGLGLSISRDLAALLGGNVSVQSDLGAGSTFTLWLPEHLPEDLPGRRAGTPPRRRAGDGSGADAAPATATLPTLQPVPAPAASSVDVARPAGAPKRKRTGAGNGRMLLVIEDDPAFAGILRDLAAEHGFEAVLAQDAGQGLAALHEHEISAVLLDMHLPDRTGLSLLDEIKRDPETRHIPVHVVSVADYSHEALSRGAVGYALKPVDREQVADALRRLDSRLSPGVRRVMVVEDDARQRESVRQLLSTEGVEIVPAETAARALELLQQNTFDCMVLDLNLPDLSGYELLEKMGDLDGVSYPPVIVYTGRSLNRDEEQRLRRFSRSIIIKDARSPERLLDEVTLFLHQVESELPPERQRMLRAARDREEAFDGRRILVVEDDVRNIFALSKVLEPRGAHIDIARNGLEALHHLERTWGREGAPDLVLMDIMMPEMDGLTAMREIRKRAEWKRLPIIALTAKAMRDDQEKCLQAGANDYLAKPLDIERLLSLVRVWLPQ